MIIFIHFSSGCVHLSNFSLFVWLTFCFSDAMWQPVLLIKAETLELVYRRPWSLKIFVFATGTFIWLLIHNCLCFSFFMGILCLFIDWTVPLMQVWNAGNSLRFGKKSIILLKLLGCRGYYKMRCGKLRFTIDLLTALIFFPYLFLV